MMLLRYAAAIVTIARADILITIFVIRAGYATFIDADFSYDIRCHAMLSSRDATAAAAIGKILLIFCGLMSLLLLPLLIRR